MYVCMYVCSKPLLLYCIDGGLCADEGGIGEVNKLVQVELCWKVMGVNVGALDIATYIYYKQIP